MKRFESRQIREAKAHALEGGQALHVWDPGPDWKRAPKVFRENRPWAHLFDQDAERLVQTARRLGVRIIKVERPGTEYQHIDLCAGPLKRAMAECT